MGFAKFFKENRRWIESGYWNPSSGAEQGGGETGVVFFSVAAHDP
jgi:hypothetical protein